MDAQKSTDNIASFIIEGDSEEIVKKRLNDIEDWFNNGSVWNYSNPTHD
ncbi:hypothetical protein JCM31447_24250 [Fluviispira sanaruensis]|uniref:Uncharacterized protein n=1 Tax=Fluviispira sanaruensis TaxID=2493639 RepID=A0A4P2VY44_FLUSA|nr:hypothetical protein JCM31447_24250 [Fluviispira sanaruensis]